MYQSTTVHIGANNRDNLDLGVLNRLCYHSARLYNVGLFSVRQHFFNTTKYLSYYDNYHECKNNEHYSVLLTDTGQQILRLVDRDMKSFFRLLTLKKYGKYSADVRLPRYKDKEGLTTFILQGKSARIHSDKVRVGLTKDFRALYNLNYSYLEISIPKNIRWVTSFKELRIKPIHGGKEFEIIFTYKSQNVKQIPRTADGFLSVDLGINNLMACTIFSNKQCRQFLIDGKPLKSINAYYNKMTSKLKSEYSKNTTIEVPSTTNRMLRLSNGRKHRIDNYFNNAVKMVVEMCFEYNVNAVVIGYNKGQGQGINIGKANNQNFTTIPFHKLRFKLKNKLELHGITCEFQEESYTSKASSLDDDLIPTFGNECILQFSGKRIYRGLYKSKERLKLNADINGSINILKKYFKERKWNWTFQDHVRALVNVPCQRLNAFAKAHSL